MATGNPNVLAQLSQEILFCDTCTEEFDSQARIPRILPCYHAFCGPCLEKLGKDGTFHCPKCRRVTALEGGFPVDATRMVLLDLKRSVWSEKGVPCEGCTEGGMAACHCQECAEFLCDDCCAAHRRLKILKDHTILPLSEAARFPDKFVQTSETCERHADEKLKLFCVTCSKTVCPLCALLEHKKCEDLVELDSVLDDKKKEMLALCELLDGFQQSFCKKAEESETSLEAIEPNLDKAVHQVEGVFAEVISSARERQRQVLEELRARATSDELLLEEQAATFRCLQTAAETAAEFGRRCISLSLASQVFCQNPELRKTIAELGEKNAAHVKSASVYKASTEKMAELKALLKEIGSIESTPDPSDVQDTSVTFPSFQLDASRCGSGGCVEADGCSLSNQPSTPTCTQPNPQAFKFLGTCGTAAMPGTTSYWQVRCAATPTPKFKEEWGLCEVGVATLPALQECLGGGVYVSSTAHCALTTVVCTQFGHVKAMARHGYHCLPTAPLPPSTPHSPVALTLGLLLNPAASRLHIIDVGATQLLCSSDIDLSTPMWPFVRVWPEMENGAKVHLEVQTGQQISLTKDMAGLLQALLRADSQPMEQKEP